MHLSEFYHEYGRVIDTIGTLIGGGFLVRLYYWIKHKGEEEVRVDTYLDGLNETTKELKRSIKDQSDRIDRLQQLANGTSKQQEKIEVQIEQLQEYKEDTKENTKAVVELSKQIEGLVKQIKKNNGG